MLAPSSGDGPSSESSSSERSPRTAGPRRLAGTWRGGPRGRRSWPDPVRPPGPPAVPAVHDVVEARQAASGAPSRAAPRPDAAGTSTAYSGSPSTSASSCRQPAARVPPRPAAAGRTGPAPGLGLLGLGLAGRCVPGVPDRERGSLERAPQERRPVVGQRQRGPGAAQRRIGIRCPLARQVRDEDRVVDLARVIGTGVQLRPAGVHAPRTQLRLSPALRVAPMWYQPSGFADRSRLTPASARLTLRPGAG